MGRPHIPIEFVFDNLDRGIEYFDPDAGVDVNDYLKTLEWISVVDCYVEKQKPEHKVYYPKSRVIRVVVKYFENGWSKNEKI